MSNVAVALRAQSRQHWDDVASRCDFVRGSNPQVGTEAAIQVEGRRKTNAYFDKVNEDRLETPWETIVRLTMNEPSLGASLKIVKDLKLLEKWHERGDGVEDAKTHADMVGCQAELLVRILRHLLANHMLEEVSAGTFKPTRFSIALMNPVIGEWLTILYDVILPSFLKAPEYLASTNYVTPTDPENGIFQVVKGFRGSLWQWYEQNPELGASFNQLIGGVMANQACWLDILPAPVLQDILFGDEVDAESPLLVDVGGSIGHDMNKFIAAYPDLAPRQKSQTPCTKMGHDFFTPQPVTGARVYYVHAVLHDWSDEPASRILQVLKPALKKGYSKLLVHDHVIPEVGVHSHTTAYDLNMMVSLAALERTEKQWRTLLESVGYKVMNVWRSPLAVQAVVEAELA
ncbi:S-adenosyl-L-methionine-dependent methyltransferase [Aspergillus falconensis]